MLLRRDSTGGMRMAGNCIEDVRGLGTYKINE